MTTDNQKYKNVNGDFQSFSQEKPSQLIDYQFFKKIRKKLKNRIRKRYGFSGIKQFYIFTCNKTRIFYILLSYEVYIFEIMRLQYKA